MSNSPTHRLVLVGDRPSPSDNEEEPSQVMVELVVNPLLTVATTGTENVEFSSTSLPVPKSPICASPSLNLAPSAHQDKDSSNDQIPSVKGHGIKSSSKARTSPPRPSIRRVGTVVKETPVTSYRKTLKHKPEDKEIIYIEDAKKRGRAARERAETMQKRAKEYCTVTGGTANFKALYTNEVGLTTTWVYPPDSTDVAFPVTSTEVPNANLAKSISTSVIQGLKSYIQPPTSTQTLQLTPTKQLFVSKIFSPEKVIPSKQTKQSSKKRSRDDSKCGFCFKSKVEFEGRSYESGWFGCSHSSTIQCPVWVHADCYGFVGTFDDQIAKFPNWYCRLHRQQARLDLKVACETIPAPSGSDSAAPAKRGRGRGRGKL